MIENSKKKMDPINSIIEVKTKKGSEFGMTLPLPLPLPLLFILVGRGRARGKVREA
jgi:hypothetical protein